MQKTAIYVFIIVSSRKNRNGGAGGTAILWNALPSKQSAVFFGARLREVVSLFFNFRSAPTEVSVLGGSFILEFFGRGFLYFGPPCTIL